MELDCSPLGFLSQGSAFLSLNLGPLIGLQDPLNLFTYGLSLIDAIGYNVLDDFVYGLAQTGIGAGDLIRIGAGGQSQLVVENLTPNILNNDLTIFTVGDVDDQGGYWAATSLIGSNAQTWFRVNLAPDTAGYGTVTNQGTATLPYPIYDWVYVPGAGNYLYALGTVPLVLIPPQLATTALIRFDRTTQTWSEVKNYGTIIGTNTWGATFATSNGNIYAVESITGQIWKFPVTNNGSASFVSQFVPQGLIDGARCFNAPDPQ